MEKKYLNIEKDLDYLKEIVHSLTTKQIATIKVDSSNINNIISSYTTSSKNKDSSYEFYYARAFAYFFKKDYKLAKRNFNIVISLNAKYTKEVYYYLGNIYKKEKNYKTALEIFKKALKIDDRYFDIYYSMSDIYFKDSYKDYKKSLEYLTKAIEINSKVYYTYYRRAYLYYKMGESYNYKAIADLIRAIEINPAKPQSYSLRGKIYLKMTFEKEAFSDFLKAIELKSSNNEVYKYVIQYYLKNNDISKAHIFIEKHKEYFKEINLSSDTPNKGKLSEIYRHQGDNYFDKENYSKALDLYKISLGISKRNFFSYFKIGVINMKKHNYDKALIYLSKSIEINSRFKKPYYYRSKVYQAFGDNYNSSSDMDKYRNL